MDCLVRLFYGGSVRKEDGVLQDMDEELEWFDDPPSFSDLLLRVEQKFVGHFTLKGRFDSGKTRAHYILMPLRNEGHWLRYTRVIQQSNVTLAEVVVENGYRKEDVEDGRRVIQESNDQGGRDAMPVPVQGRLVRDVPGPTEIDHAGQGGTLMAALVPLSVVRPRPQHHCGINLDEGHPLNGAICFESPDNQKGKKMYGKMQRSMNTDTPPTEPIPELSNEIVLDILVRLPVKSLLRCKSVCKGWRAIITDPFFVRAHLKHSASRCEQDPCLLITPHSVRGHFVSDHIRFYLWQQGASMATLLHERKKLGAATEFGSGFAQCDGLVLAPTTDARLYLFNPATRETITLPDRDWHHSGTWQRCRCAGLGLDPRTGQHKVVRAFYRSIDPDTLRGTNMGMEVFTISGNSNSGNSAWREIKDDLPYPAAEWNTGTAVNGFLFWCLAYKHRNLERPWGLLRLSLADETFGITRLPDSARCVSPHDEKFDVLHGELCMSVRISKYTVTMWFLPIQEDGGQGQTWEQRYTVHLTCVYRPLAFLPGGHMLVYTNSNVCLYDVATAKLTLVCQVDRMKYQWSKSTQGRRLHSWSNRSFNVSLYTESLVRISV